MAAIVEALQELGDDTVLVAHSLGCLAVAHWAAFPSVRAGGALLVSPPDPASPSFPRQAMNFSPVPLERFSFPSIVVASSNDPYLSLLHAKVCAGAWGSRLYEAGARGHLGATDGLSHWPIGKALLDELNNAI